MSKHYVIDENHNLIEAYSAQEVLSVLEQAIADGSIANVVAGQAFVDRLKCCVSGQTNRIAFVSQAKYNELEKSGAVERGVYYYITDDTTLEGINATLEELTAFMNGLKEGSISVKSLKLGEEDFKFSTYIKGSIDIGDSVIPYNVIYSAVFVEKDGSVYTGMFTNIKGTEGFSCFGSLGGAKMEYIESLKNINIESVDGVNLEGELTLRKIADM